MLYFRKAVLQVVKSSDIVAIQKGIASFQPCRDLLISSAGTPPNVSTTDASTGTRVSQLSAFSQDEVRRRILYTLNMTKVVQHLWEAIRFENALAVVPVFDKERPIRSTGDMQPWFTRRPCEPAVRSHINLCVFDSRWEASEAFELDRNSNVAAWVKNDHLGFEILYVFKGVILKYRPDYLIRLTNGKMLVLEVKGQESQQDRTKREFLLEWSKAVNQHGGFGIWASDVSFSPADFPSILTKHNQPS